MTQPENTNDSEHKGDPAQNGSSADMHVSDNKLSAAKAILWTAGKCLAALLPVYLAGYYRISTSLVAFGMVVYAGWKHTREAKEARLRSAIQMFSDEGQTSSSSSNRDLVNFPDVEKVEWLNKVIRQAWPFIGQYLEKLLLETIAPSIRGSSIHLQTLNFTKIDFGDKPMKVVGVKAHTENVKGQILLDVYISYVGNAEINVEVKRYFCKAGVKGIQLQGMMRVILEPLIGDVPIVGAVTMFFIQRPKLNINWTGLTNLLDIPGLNVMSDTMIMDAIASFLVLPNRLTVPLVSDLPVAQLRCPLPRGVVRIHLLGADGLASKDNYVKGVVTGMSDPYALLRVGPQTFKSRHQDNTHSPKWDEMYEVIVHEVPGQELEVEVFDKDPDHDDFLGRTKLDLGIVKKSKIVDEWLTLMDTQTGRVHLRLEWLKLESSTERLEQVLKRNESVVSKTANPPSAAILAVYLDRAEALPMKKGSKDPNPIVQLSVQDVTRDSRICWNTVNPHWEDAFTFFIRDPSKQDINIQVKDNDRVQMLGNLSIPVSRLLTCPELTLDQWFNLENSGPDSRIHINTVLRVLWLDEDAVNFSLLSSDSHSKGSVPRPQKTTPHSSFATEGVLRIHLVEGQNLVPKDNKMGGIVKGKSDPYVKIQIGGETFKSQVIKENLNPTWNEMYEVVLTELPGQELSLEVFDKDMDMKDDFMGRLNINLSDIISSQYIHEWFSLNDVKCGRVHLTLEWLPAVTQAETLQQVLRYQSKSSYLNTEPTAAVLFVYVERAHNLPLKKSGKEPKVGAELILGGASHRTTVCDRTSSPQWNEAFHFLVRDPLNEDLVVRLSHCWDFSLGSVVIPIKELLSEPELILDQWLNLDGASPDSQILVRAQLKILCPKETKSFVEQDEKTERPETSSIRRKQQEEMQKSGVEEVPESPVAITPSVSVPEEEEEEEVPEVSSSVDLRPLHTSPDPSFGSEGLLRLHLLEAQNLIAKDNMMGGMVKGKSDPYVKIQIGETTFKSHVIKENLNPFWNEMYELVLTSDSTSDVLVEVFDKDMDKDDFLGRVKISLQDIIHSQFMDQWFTLSDVKHGRIHVLLEWLPTVTQPHTLQKALQLQSTHSYQNKCVPSVALLNILLERARALPQLKGGKEPRAAAELVLGDVSHKTQVCESSTSPQWSEAFHFLVHDPEDEILIVKLSNAWAQPLGSLVLPIRELLVKPDLLMDQWLSLDGAEPGSEVLLRAQLKILDSKLDPTVHLKKSAVEDPFVGGDHKKKEPITAEQTQTAVSKMSDKKTLPKKELSELVASTLPVPVSLSEEHQKHEPAPVMEDHHVTPSAPKTKPDTEALRKIPDSTVSESGHVTEPIKTSGSEAAAHEEQQETDKQSYKKTPPASVEESKVSSSSDVRPQKTSPDPSFGHKGVLRIHLLEAQDLVAQDNLMGGMIKGKSDPYVKIHVGETTFKSHVIKENLNPTWNEMYELILSPDHHLDVKFEVYDKDVDSDDFLGRFKLKLGHIITSQYNDEWFTLNDIKHGRVHLVLEWLPTVTQQDKLEQVLQMQSVQTYQNKCVPSAGLLFIHLDRAHELPLKKSGKEPKAAAELVLAGTSLKSKVCDRSASPQWNETFQFLVHDPRKDMLIIKLSSAWDQPMGSLVLPIRELLSKPNLLMDQWLNLDGALPRSQILLRAQLKILDSKMAALLAMGSGPVLSNKQAATTGQIKISISFQKKLTVIIHACRNLVTSSKDGLDTYVSLILLPDKSKATKKKTSVKKKNLNPEYNERFEFDLSVEEVRQQELSVCVKNASSSFMHRDKDVIGQVQINLEHVDLLSGVTEWFDLQEDN